MAWRRLASGTAAAHLRRHVVSSPPLAAPSRAFSAANPTLLGREALQGIRSRCSSSPPAFQARAPGLGLGALLAARVSSGARPKLSGLLKGFGAGGSAIAVMLYPREVAQAAGKILSLTPGTLQKCLCFSSSGLQGKTFSVTGQRPAGISSQDNALLSPDTKQMLRKLWNLLRKFQLPIGLILLVVYSWKKPIVLAINTLLLLYSTRPDPYSIYLFLQEIHQGKVRQNPALWRDEFMQTRKVDTEDYKFFSIGRVELKDGTVLHAIGILGNWWTYHVSYAKRVQPM
ncbi:uncharacterized protein [Lolium perenne]|uniref:uncharacterized protein n=1 Tax=Lolium perenne TaxID=4522 RepID=UPI003A98FF2E